MKKNGLKWIATLGCLALVGVALISAAAAHIGVSHSPFTTDSPDLRTVTVDDGIIDFCFDEEVIGPQPINEAKFGLRGYNSGTLAVGDDAGLDPSNKNCVEVDFDTARAVEQFTIGVVLTDAVEDREGNGNIVASAALTDSEVESAPGLTDAPNLTLNFKVDSIEFVLDEDMNCGAMGASAFGYYKDEGTSSPSYGTGVKDCDDNEAVIEFGAPVEDIARVFVDPANGNEPCAPAPSGACVGWESEGDETDDPDLGDAERDGEDVTFSFDEDIAGTPDETKFQVSAEDGTKSDPSAGSCDIESNDRDVTCEFPAIEDAGDSEIVLAGVGECAVMSDENAAQCSTIGDASMETSGHAPGATDGPDLETCEVDEAANTAELSFDEIVNEGSAVTNRFLLFDNGGKLTPAEDVKDATGNIATVEFDQDAIAEAVGCIVAFDALDDFLGNQSPEAAVGFPQPTQTTTSSGASTPPPPEVTPVTTQLSLKYAKGKGAFVGDAFTDQEGCRGGRKVTVKKKRSSSNTNVGSNPTNAAGHFRVPAKRASGRFYAIIKEKVFSAEGETFLCKRAKSPTIKVGGRR